MPLDKITSTVGLNGLSAHEGGGEGKFQYLTKRDPSPRGGVCLKKNVGYFAFLFVLQWLVLIMDDSVSSSGI